MGTISNVPRPGYVWDATDNVWYPIGVGAHQHTNAADTPAVMPYSTYAAAGKNKILNGDFAINQRGFTSTTAGGYTFDRHVVGQSGGTVTATARTFTPGEAPVVGYEGKNFIEIATTGQSATTDLTQLNQRIESVRTLAGQTVTFSFWAKSSSGTPKLALEFQQFFGSGGSATVNTFAGQVTISTSWQRYSVTVNVPSITGKTVTTSGDDWVRPTIWASAGSDWNSRTGSLGIQNATISFWGIQVEESSTVTAFQTATGNPASELAACQRYLPAVVATNGELYTGLCYTSTQAIIQCILPVTPRVPPTGITVNAVGNFRLRNSGASKLTVTGMNFSTASNNSCTLDVSVSSGLSAGNATALFNESGGTIFFTGCEL